MKSKYIKPQLHIENFTLSQSVAQYCNAVPGGNSNGYANHWDIYSCGWDMSGLVIWMDIENTVCNEFGEEDDIVLGMCYNNPEGGTPVFGS